MCLELVLEAVELAGKISGMGTPNLPSGGADNSITVTVFNQTQYTATFIGSYFDSGRFDSAPTNVQPFSSMTFSGCPSDGSIATGVSGGVEFQLQMPTAGGANKTLEIDIGFTNPYIGSVKSSALFNGGGAEGAYNAVSDNSTQTTSASFSGVDTNGNPVTINFSAVSAPGQQASITITEMTVAGGD